MGLIGLGIDSMGLLRCISLLRVLLLPELVFNFEDKVRLARLDDLVRQAAYFVPRSKAYPTHASLYANG
jgi:hypothetical protein